MTGDLFLQNLLALPTVMRAALSPDGRWVAFEWYRVHPNQDVFLAPTDGSAQPIPLTRTGETTRLVSWTFDSCAVLLSEDRGGDERLRLFRVDLDSPGVLQPLTEENPPYFLRGGQLAPDGQYLYYGANYDFSGGQVIEPTWMYRHTLATGERVALARPERPAYTVPELNPAGTHLIYARKDRHPSGRQYHLVDVCTGTDREILNFGAEVKVFARWLPDSTRLLVVAEGTERGPQEHISLGLYDIRTGELAWLLDDPARAIEAAWVSPDGLIVVDEMQAANHHPSFIDPKNGVETRFPGVSGNFRPLGRAADGAWIGTYYSATSPPDLGRIEPGATGISSLTGLWTFTSLRPEDLAPAEKFTWRADDGLELQGWLYRAAPNPRRAVVYIHGGPSSHAEDELSPQIQYFVRQGFNVLAVNYRGSTGFGLKFRELIKIDGWGGREQGDIAAGARALITAGLAEPGRIGVTGGSFGGYSAWFQITHQPVEVIAAAAPVCGMTDLVVDYETTRPDLRPYSEEMLGGRPDQAPERYYERSPVHFVQNIKGGLLIVQGGRDPNVTPENVRQVVTRLEQHGIPYDLLVFDDEGHGIKKPANQLRLYAALAQFFDRALGS